MLFGEVCLLEPHHGVACVLPTSVADHGDDIINSVEREIRGLVAVAFVDQSLHVVAPEVAEAEAELHPVIRLRRTVEAGGGVKSGLPLGKGTSDGAWSTTAARKRWRTVVIVAAIGGVGVWERGFLHD